MRLFIAVEIPEDIKKYLVELQNKIESNEVKIKYVKKEGMHLTLKFLGEVQQEKVDEIKRELGKIKFKPFSLNLDSIRVFSNEKYIRVIWVGLKPEDDINKLQKEIDDILNKWFKKEKDFKAHLTLARVKYVENKEIFMQELKKIKVESKKIEIKNFKLINSKLGREGPVYEDLGVF